MPAHTRLLLAALACAGCLDDAAVVCGDLLCPVASVCLAGACADRDLVEPCLGQVEGAPCTLAGIGAGECLGGLCRPIGCGNGIRNGGEACDDGNTTAGDGCSPDCASDERCGNQVIDFAGGETCDDGNALSHDGCHSGCEQELTSWEDLTANAPSGTGHAAAYDARSGTVVLFTEGVVGQTWEFDGARWQLRRPDTSPPPRQEHAMVYDAGRGRVVLFGGDGAPTGGVASLADTWEWDGATWLRRTGVAPPVRRRHAMAYDAARRRVVLFGGQGASYLNDTWEWDGLRWSNRQPVESPSARGGAAMAYDPVRQRVVLFGGNVTGNSSLRDTWLWDGEAWTQGPTGGPESRRDARMVFDAGRGQVVLYGGSRYSSTTMQQVALRDTWTWDGAAWAELATPDDAGSQIAPALTYDTTRARVVLVGGGGGGIGTWELTGTTWTEHTRPTVPPPRDGHSLTAFGAGLVLFGGRSGNTERGDTWRWDGDTSTWQALAVTPAPVPRFGHAASVDAGGARVILFGGAANGGVLQGDTWAWDGTSWSNLTSTSTGPVARQGHALALDPTRGRVVLFGGRGDAGLLDDTWTWDGAAWTTVVPATRPPGRSGHALAYDPDLDRVVLFGGTDGMIERSDTWLWDGATWVEVVPVEQPDARVGHTLVFDPQRRQVVLFGGRAGATDLLDTWAFTSSTWEFLGTQASPPARSGHAATWDTRRGELVIMGGRAASVLNDTWRLRPSAARLDEACRLAIDRDGDGRVGCDDPDCWVVCSPACSPAPGATCDPAGPRCGDGACAPALESCRSCPGDCGACAPVCGDLVCDAGEVCPADCVP